MSEPTVKNQDNQSNNQWYWGAGADGQAAGTGTRNAPTVDADNDGQIDDRTNDNRGLGGGAHFVLGHRWQNTSSPWSFDLSGAFGGNYLFDPNGMQYYVPAEVDSGLFGTSSTEPTCDSPNCGDIKASRFPSVDLTLRGGAVYAFDDKNALAFGPVLEYDAYINAYTPARVEVDGEMRNTDGSIPLHGAVRGGARIAYERSLSEKVKIAPYVQVTDGIAWGGLNDESSRVLPGSWGASVGVELTSVIDSDADNDGLSDKKEKQYDTDRHNPDTDADGLTDGEEVNTYGTNPNLRDTDGDGLTDGEEVNTYTTDPLNKDTDADELNDGEEVLIHETDPKNPDTDGDTLKDGAEVKTHLTDPHKFDTDEDRLSDGLELETYINTNPLNPDTDGDELTDGREYIEVRTNPKNPDTDGDALYDGVEVDTLKTFPDVKDTDQDGLEDGTEQPEAVNIPSFVGAPTNTDNDEQINALDPDDDYDTIPTATEIADAPSVNSDVDRDGQLNWLDTDSDGDGILDRAEPTDADNTGIKDYLEVNGVDSDGDGLPDALEAQIGSNPNLKDSDKDGITDNVEYTDAVDLRVKPDLNTLYPEVKSWDDADGDSNKNWNDPDADEDGRIDGGKAEGKSGEGRVDADGDGLLAYLDRSDTLVRKEGDWLKFDGEDNIKFKVKSFEIRKESEAILISLIDFVNKHPEIKKIYIEGHTSSEGTTEYNQKLSENRAESVRKFFVDHGLRQGVTLEVIGYGESRLKVDDSDKSEDKRTINRRTEFRIEETREELPVEVQTLTE